MQPRAAVAGTAALLALLSACSSSSNDQSAPPSSQSGSGSASGTASATASSGASAPATPQVKCPIGVYEVIGIKTKKPVTVGGQPARLDSSGGLKLTMNSGGTWVLSGQQASLSITVGVQAVGATADLTVSGSYTGSGSQYTFTRQKTEGTVALVDPIGGASTATAASIADGLVPAGSAALTCTDKGFTLSNDALEATLQPSADQSTTPPPAPIVINTSGRTQTQACKDNDLVVNGSTNHLTVTGSCTTITINGSNNTVTAAKVGHIVISGSSNALTWSAGTSGDPKVDNNGAGNKVVKG